MLNITIRFLIASLTDILWIFMGRIEVGTQLVSMKIELNFLDKDDTGED
jgi:hypothetical protein